MNSLRFVFRLFFKRRQLDKDLDDELASHIAMETSLRTQEGEMPEAARHAALRQFGIVGLVAEATRGQCYLGPWVTHIPRGSSRTLYMAVS